MVEFTLSDRLSLSVFFKVRERRVRIYRFIKIKKY